MVFRSGVRVGAAAFALGLVLVGPQAGSAAAEGGDSEGAAVSSGSGDARGGAVKPGRSAGQARPVRVVEREAAAPARRGAPARSAGRPDARAANDAPGEGVGEPAAARSEAVRRVRVEQAVPGAAAAVSVIPDRPVVRSAAVSVAPVGAAAQVTCVCDAAPAPVDAAASLEALNTAIVGWFDSARRLLAILPGGPLTDLLSGALLLVRRTLFNQLPTAKPFRYLTSVTGDLVGTLGARDAEGDAVTYRLLQAPQNGTAQIAADGTWTYTPGPAYASGDEFTVAVGDQGLNLLDPFSGRVTEVTVRVGNSAKPQLDAPRDFSSGFDIVNLTPTTLGLNRVGGIDDRGQFVDLSSWILGAPPTCESPVKCGSGSLLNPGDTAHFEIAGTFTPTIGFPDVSAIFTDPTDVSRQWWTVMKFNQDAFPFGAYTRIEGASTGRPGYQDGDTYMLFAGGQTLFGPDSALAALVGPPNATTTLAPTDQDAPQLLTLFLANPWFQALSKLVMTNVVFNGNPPGDPGYTRQVSVDNTGDAPGSINKTVSSSTSTTNGSNWEVSGKVSFSLFEKILGLEVAGKYGKSVSEATSKTFTTTVTSTSLPWSANEILTAPPKLLVTGDAQYVLGPRTYVFTDIQFYFPSQTLDAPLYLIQTEPLQPKYTAADNVAPGLIGTPIPNVGFSLRDKSSQFLSPTYTVGQRSQLTVSAYQGVGAAADKTGDPRTIYSTSNAAVATVNKTGALTAVGPGTATITARYDWSIPYGGGSARNDYVLATMDVTVQ